MVDWAANMGLAEFDCKELPDGDLLMVEILKEAGIIPIKEKKGIIPSETTMKEGLNIEEEDKKKQGLEVVKMGKEKGDKMMQMDDKRAFGRPPELSLKMGKETGDKTMQMKFGEEKGDKTMQMDDMHAVGRPPELSLKMGKEKGDKTKQMDDMSAFGRPPELSLKMGKETGDKTMQMKMGKEMGDKTMEGVVDAVICCMSCGLGCSCALFVIALVWVFMQMDDMRAVGRPPELGLKMGKEMGDKTMQMKQKGGMIRARGRPPELKFKIGKETGDKTMQMDDMRAVGRPPELRLKMGKETGDKTMQMDDMMPSLMGCMRVYILGVVRARHQVAQQGLSFFQTEAVAEMDTHPHYLVSP
jgi:hypothetical protein